MKRQKGRGKVGESVTIRWKINKRKKKKVKNKGENVGNK